MRNDQRSKKPGGSSGAAADATTGYPLLDRIAPVSHYGFYVLALLMIFWSMQSDKPRRALRAEMSAVLTHPEITPQRPHCLAGLRGLELANVILGKSLKCRANSPWITEHFGT
jgi:hypothetical protein